MENKPITREEILLNAVATGEAASLEPITREEMFLAKLGGADVKIPTPITRKEQFLQKAIEGGGSGGGSGGVTINNQDKTITENGVYQADEGYTGLGTVTVEVASTGGGDIDALIDRSITEISSNAEIVGNYVFQNCANLTTVDFPAATSIGNNAFQNCANLTTVDFPAATSIGIYAFQNCANLTTVDFPAATSVVDYAFQRCPNLTTADFPAATSIGNNAFQNCANLTTVDFPAVTSIYSAAFQSCGRLTVLLLRNRSKIATLSNVNAFNNCYHLHGTTNATYNPQGLKDGYIYVPSALVDTYKAATNWTTFADQFRALEDYTVDGTTTGALDPNKI